MTDSIVFRKLKRLRLGGRPRVLDLFSGCGGPSLGFDVAGSEIGGAVEFDADVARSHDLNLHDGAAAHSQAIDVTEITPAQLYQQLGLESVADAFDVIVGGHACQAFARVGRYKLREIEEHPEAFIHDPRAQLYKILEYVDTFQPLAVLMECVPDILNHGSHYVAEETCEVLSGKGSLGGHTLLNAAFYGVLQMRECMFLIAYWKKPGADVSFSVPTH